MRKKYVEIININILGESLVNKKYNTLIGVQIQNQYANFSAYKNVDDTIVFNDFLVREDK